MANPRTSTSLLQHSLNLRWTLPLLAVLCALPWVAAALGDSFYVTLATRILVFALAATSLNLILGFGGMVSFGHAAFVGVGAYTVGILMQHGITSAWLAWPLAMAVSALLALLIGTISLRTQGVYFIMITLAFAQMLYYLAVSLKAYGGDDGLSLPGRSALGFELSDTALYYVTLALLVATIVFVTRLLNARFGQALQAIRENEVRMAALGYAVLRYKLVAFTLAGALTGLAGALLANQGSFVSPSLMQWSQSGMLMVMVILGGVGHVLGGLVGAAAFLLMEEFLGHLTEHWQLGLGALLLLVVLVAPQGLMSLFKRRAP
ncbi:branched-chain amino acid ABC transporter permease [Rhodoferax sp.]|uniref:branched-chain amino acid ABC transporter permease n=1 Tax=Rhodoferax sp. TaxID=50421 RepID=UPI002ACDD845|nr:branched-chain amino acid ABC transporter permease [Rhodoferax sp.]MDZ7921940.1 branched-chain amino acid ABC transporter permease [Rhodoferax sp.]